MHVPHILGFVQHIYFLAPVAKQMSVTKLGLHSAVKGQQVQANEHGLGQGYIWLE